MDYFVHDCFPTAKPLYMIIVFLLHIHHVIDYKMLDMLQEIPPGFKLAILQTMFSSQSISYFYTFTSRSITHAVAEEETFISKTVWLKMSSWQKSKKVVNFCETPRLHKSFR